MVRAWERPDLFEKYEQGYKNVLLSYGLESVSSLEESHEDLNDTYLILIGTENMSTVYGGAKIIVSNANNTLPIEHAIGEIDPRIIEYVKNIGPGRIAEICGLWNMRAAAGLGIGSIYLIRTSIAVLDQLNHPIALALCSPFTVRMQTTFGFGTLESIGNQGTFHYPTETLLATVTFLDDSRTMGKASELERSKIMWLRENPNSTIFENSPSGKLIEVVYRLNP